MLLDGGLEGLGVGAYDLGNLVAVLEEEEGGHGADAELLRYVGHLVDIELVKARLGVGVGESGDCASASCAMTATPPVTAGVGYYSLDHLRRNDLARPAPGREAVEHKERVLGLQCLVEVGLPARAGQRLCAETMTSPARNTGRCRSRLTR